MPSGDQSAYSPPRDVTRSTASEGRAGQHTRQLKPLDEVAIGGNRQISGAGNRQNVGCLQTKGTRFGAAVFGGE